VIVEKGRGKEIVAVHKFEEKEEKRTNPSSLTLLST